MVSKPIVLQQTFNPTALQQPHNSQCCNELDVDNFFFVDRQQLDNSFTVDYFPNTGRISKKHCIDRDSKSERCNAINNKTYFESRNPSIVHRFSHCTAVGRKPSLYNETAQFVTLADWGSENPIGSPPLCPLNQKKSSSAALSLLADQQDPNIKSISKKSKRFRSPLYHCNLYSQSHSLNGDTSHSMNADGPSETPSGDPYLETPSPHAQLNGKINESTLTECNRGELNRLGVPHKINQAVHTQIQRSVDNISLGWKTNNFMVNIGISPAFSSGTNGTKHSKELRSQSNLTEEEHDESLLMIGVTLLYCFFVGLEASCLYEETKMTIHEYFSTVWLTNAGIYALFTLIYVGEMLFYWRSISIRYYFSSLRHQAEFFFLCCLLINCILSFAVVPFVDAYPKALSVIVVLTGILRVCVVLRLLQSVKPLEIVTRALSGSLKALVVTAIFIILFLYIFANLATRTLAEHHDDEVMQRLWGSFGSSMYTLFMIITLDGIFDFVSDSIKSHDLYERPWVALFFFIFIISTSILWLNVVTGVIVDAYLHSIYEYRQRKGTAEHSKKSQETISLLSSVFFNDDDVDEGAEPAILSKNIFEELYTVFDEDCKNASTQPRRGRYFLGNSMEDNNKEWLTQNSIDEVQHRRRCSTVTSDDLPAGDEHHRMLILCGKSAWELLMDPTWRKAIRNAQVPEHKAYDVLRILTDFDIESVTVKEFAEACLMVGGKSTGRDLLISQLEQRVGHTSIHDRVRHLNGVMARTRSTISRLLIQQKKTGSLAKSTSFLSQIEKTALRRQKTHPITTPHRIGCRSTDRGCRVESGRDSDFGFTHLRCFSKYSGGLGLRNVTPTQDINTKLLYNSLKQQSLGQASPSSVNINCNSLGNQKGEIERKTTKW